MLPEAVLQMDKLNRVDPLRSILIQFLPSELLCTLHSGIARRLELLEASSSRRRKHDPSSEHRPPSSKEFQALIVLILTASLHGWKTRGQIKPHLRRLVGDRLNFSRYKVLIAAFGHEVDYMELAATLSRQWSSFCNPPSAVAVDESLWAYQASAQRCEYIHIIPRKTHPKGLLAYCACSSFQSSKKPYLHWMAPFLSLPQLSGADAVRRFVRFYRELPRARGSTTPPLLLVMDSLFSSATLRSYLQRRGVFYVLSANVQWAQDLWKAMELGLSRGHYRVYDNGSEMVYCLRGRRDGVFRNFTNAYRSVSIPAATPTPEFSAEFARLLASAPLIDLQVLASKCGEDSSGTANDITRRITGHDLDQEAADAARAAHPPGEDEPAVQIDGHKYGGEALSAMTVKTLKQLCVKLNLRSNGSKEELVRRLLKAGRLQQQPTRQREQVVTEFKQKQVKIRHAESLPPQHSDYKAFFNGIDKP